MAGGSPVGGDPPPFFAEVPEPIEFEGLDTDNPLAFRWYDAQREVGGHTMAEQLRFAVSYWHSFAADGADMFGSGTWDRPWLDASPEDAMTAAHQKMAGGIDMSENGQAMSAIREVGPGSHYLGCTHTRENFQSAFHVSNVADNNSFEQWEVEGGKRTEERANQIARSWLDNYHAPDLDPAIDEGLKDFIKQKKDSMPDAFT